jgi:two-component system nitrate/nitrite response regulator NarL
VSPDEHTDPKRPDPRHAGRRPHPVPQGAGGTARGQRGTITVAAIPAIRPRRRLLPEAAQPDVLSSTSTCRRTAASACCANCRAGGWIKPTLVLTVSDAEDDLANAMRAGARGYLLKDMEPDDVIDALQRAVRGETVVAPAMTLKLVNLLQGGGKSAARDNLLAQLTAREREILDHLAQGQSNKAIARALDISHDTVKLHVRHILSKLNLTSRVEAAVFAVEQKAAGQARRNS